MLYIEFDESSILHMWLHSPEQEVRHLLKRASYSIVFGDRHLATFPVHSENIFRLLEQYKNDVLRIERSDWHPDAFGNKIHAEEFNALTSLNESVKSTLEKIFWAGADVRSSCEVLQNELRDFSQDETAYLPEKLEIFCREFEAII